MLNVLLESRAPRTRRTGSTIASALVHGALIAAAVALTIPGPATATAIGRPDAVFVVPPTHPAPTPTSARPARMHSVPVEQWAPPTIPFMPVISSGVTDIDVGPALPPDDGAISGPGVGTTSPIGGSGIGSGDGGAPLD